MRLFTVMQLCHLQHFGITHLSYSTPHLYPLQELVTFMKDPITVDLLE